MPAQFDLKVNTEYPGLGLRLRLLDASGLEVAANRVDLASLTRSESYGIFDLQNFLRTYVDEGQEEDAIAQMGACLAHRLLGPEIFRVLTQDPVQRTLRIELPAASGRRDHLAAVLTRVPWELARAAADQPSLADRHLQVRIVQGPAPTPPQTKPLGAGEPFRILFVLAETDGSTPLAIRQEHRQLLRLMLEEVYPRTTVWADFLMYGVTRERLEWQVQQHGGYHAVHWSGHGDPRSLRLWLENGGSDAITGADLLDLMRRAGGHLPHFVFLSACHSGDTLAPADWDEFLALVGRAQPRTPALPAQDLDIEHLPVLTGPAQALVQGGVPTVLAMRFAVGDEYARELAVAFYRAMLAQDRPRTPSAALASARQTLLEDSQGLGARFLPGDHATPLLFGTGDCNVLPTPGRSPALDRKSPRLCHARELGSDAHPHFVGRSRELGQLASRFIGSGRDDEVEPVVVICGQAGLGKTALAAEVLALWEDHFEAVLVYQAKPAALVFEATLQDFHLRLLGAPTRYRSHVMAYPEDAVYRDATDSFQGTERRQRLIRNLVRALRNDTVLVVLDNFETNVAEADGSAAGTRHVSRPCRDPAWEACIRLLASDLLGSPSRLLITSRHSLSAVDRPAGTIQLGPLPPAEAALYLRAQPSLAAMVASSDRAQRALALRVLKASRFHPLLMDKLARLAAAPALHARLVPALDELDHAADVACLASIFGHTTDDLAEARYLEDALVLSLDQLIDATTPAARPVLWVIAMAGQSISGDLLADVMDARNHRARVRSASGDNSFPAIDRRDIEPLLVELCLNGLISRDVATAQMDDTQYVCHDLVRDRIRVRIRMDSANAVQEERSILLDYAQCFEAEFRHLLNEDIGDAIQVGCRALVYSVLAQAWDRLGGLLGDLVNFVTEPELLDEIVPYLEASVMEAPEGAERFACLLGLGDALRGRQRPDLSLPKYAQAALMIKPLAAAAGDQAVWPAVASLANNWAIALAMTNNLAAAREQWKWAAEAHRRAGDPAIKIVINELQVLRVDMDEDGPETAAPQVRARLDRIAEWWDQYRRGAPDPQAPDGEFLARAYIAALDIAVDMEFVRRDWAPALTHIDKILAVQEERGFPGADIAAVKMNRANVLMQMGQMDDARIELERCLQRVEDSPLIRSRVLASLGMLLAAQGDHAQAAVQERRALDIANIEADLADRAASHGRLGDYLDAQGTSDKASLAAFHHLAAVMYAVVIGRGTHLHDFLHNYALRMQRAAASGSPFFVPKVDEVLRRPDFGALRESLAERGTASADLQSAVDDCLRKAQDLARRPIDSGQDA